jgi:hypothetical protein
MTWLIDGRTWFHCSTTLCVISTRAIKLQIDSHVTVVGAVPPQACRRHVADVATETYIRVDQPYLRVGSDPQRLQMSMEITAGVYKNINIVRTKTTSQNSCVS